MRLVGSNLLTAFRSFFLTERFFSFNRHRGGWWCSEVIQVEVVWSCEEEGDGIGEEMHVYGGHWRWKL